MSGLLDKNAKAIVAAIIAALATASGATADSTITGAEWSGIAFTFFLALVVVWAVPNAKPKADTP